MIVMSILLLIIAIISGIAYYVYRIKHQHRSKLASIGLFILICFTMIYFIYINFVK